MDLRGKFIQSNHKVIDFFSDIGHIEVIEHRLRSWKYDLLSFATLEGFVVMSSLVLFSFGAPDLMMTGAAFFAMFCGIVLMGGRSVVSRPLRAISNLCNRSPRREPAAIVCLTFPGADRRREHDVRGIRRAA